ncbi:MAG: hypothetical protein JSR82_12045 [Verrucomicrobia bacterium]|nr:hypothetical protein [Verrucomicrobiota bacterium]
MSEATDRPSTPTAAPSRSARAAPVAAAALVAAVACALAAFRASDPDLGFHFATGRAVLALRAVPGTNVLSHTQPDHPWLLHQWAPATLFELVRVRAGIVGVTVVKIGIVALTWLVVLSASWRAAGRETAPRLAAVLLTLLGAVAASFRFVERPLLFTDLAMALVVLALVAYADAEARDRRRWLVLAGVTTVVASHLHAGAVNAYAMLLLAAGAALVEPWRARVLATEPVAPFGRADARALVVTALVAFGAAAATLALYNPHGVRVLTVPFLMTADTWQAEHLVEFRPLHRFPVRALWSAWSFVGVATLCVVAGVRRVHGALLALFFGLLFFALRHVRVAYDFAVVAAPAATLGARAVLARLPQRRTLTLRVSAVLAVAVAVIAVVGPLHNWTRFTRGFGYDEGVFPRGLVEQIRARGLVGPMYVSDGWAGPVLGELYPAERAFYDPRLEAYDPAFVRDVYQRIRYGEPGWSELLDRHRVQLVLMKYTSPGERAFQGGRDNLRQLLARDPRWALVAFDDHGELFVRVDGPNAAVARADAIPFVEPDRGTLSNPKAAWPGLARALERSPRSMRALLLGAVAARVAGHPDRARALLAEAEARDPDDPRLPAVRSVTGVAVK